MSEVPGTIAGTPDRARQFAAGRPPLTAGHRTVSYAEFVGPADQGRPLQSDSSA